MAEIFYEFLFYIEYYNIPIPFLYLLPVILLGLIYLLILSFRPRHYFKIKQSFRIIEKLKTFNNSAEIIGYLKKINPYVFEEVILSSLKNASFKIQRSKSYSGDGGIDGKFQAYGQKYFIQSKRYKKYINLKHVKEFNELCKENDVKGIFCHTGKTGKASWNEQGQYIKIISGNNLVNLITKNEISLTFK